MKTKKCKWCGEDVFRLRLCKKHYRFYQMRIVAKRHGKTVPSYEALELLWNKSKGVCEGCGRAVNWLSNEGHSTVITLQHDRSGRIRLLCLSCNTRHASFEDDTFYDQDPNMKTCPCCKRSLPLDQFGTDNLKRWKNKSGKVFSFCFKE